MALRKIAGPFEHKDLYGNYRESFIDFWCEELDGFLAYSSWFPNPSGGASEWGRGILQLDGTFTPRRSLPYGTEDVPYYDLAQRRLAWLTGAPDYQFERGGDWLSLQAPYIPETVPLAIASDGIHVVDPYTRMFLPDRMILLGYEIESGFYTGPYVTKVFSLAYGATTPPVVEHVIETTAEPGSGVLESWRPNNSFTCKLLQSGTPERSVLITRFHGGESKALEYDYVAKKVVGWVRRLGDQPTLGSPAGFNPPHLIGYSVKHKVWAVEDHDPVSSRRRVSIFADEALPVNLSNPVALSPTRAGEAVRYRVRLSGADHEPCIGHLVSWTCSAIGTVMIPQSLTDANGYAETLVSFPPKFEGPWEGTTISAEVIF